jgi:hypothetical protein
MSETVRRVLYTGVHSWAEIDAVAGVLEAAV